MHGHLCWYHLFPTSGQINLVKESFCSAALWTESPCFSVCGRTVDWTIWPRNAISTLTFVLLKKPETCSPWLAHVHLTTDLYNYTHCKPPVQFGKGPPCIDLQLISSGRHQSYPGHCPYKDSIFGSGHLIYLFHWEAGQQVKMLISYIVEIPLSLFLIPFPSTSWCFFETWCDGWLSFNLARVCVVSGFAFSPGVPWLSHFTVVLSYLMGQMLADIGRSRGW